MSNPEPPTTELAPITVNDELTDPGDSHVPFPADQIAEWRFSTGRRVAGPKVPQHEAHELRRVAADEIEWAHDKIRDLRRQLAMARIGVEIATGADPYQVDEAILAIRVDAQIEADKIIAEAEETAEQIVAEAQAYYTDAMDRVDAGELRQAPPVPTRVPVESRVRPGTLSEIVQSLPGRVEQWDAEGREIVAEAERAAEAARQIEREATAVVQQVLATRGALPAGPAPSPGSPGGYDPRSELGWTDPSRPPAAPESEADHERELELRRLMGPNPDDIDAYTRKLPPGD